MTKGLFASAVANRFVALGVAAVIAVNVGEAYANTSGIGGLVAYYSFDGDATDSSGNGYDLSGPGHNYVADRFGNGGKAIFFNGNDEMDIGTWDFELSDSFSVSCWVKTSVSKDHSGSGEEYWAWGNYPVYPMCKEDGPGAGVGFKVGVDGVTVVEHASFYQPEALTCYANIGSGWNHVCMVVENSTTVCVYVNGNLLGTGPLSQKRKFFKACFIGGERWGCYTGAIDDLAVFERALSASEVAELANSGTTPPPTTGTVSSQGLAAFYPFAGNANDSSGNGNHGVVHGASFVDGNGLYFDGEDDYVFVPNSDSLDITGPITVAAWVWQDYGNDAITLCDKDGESWRVEIYPYYGECEFGADQSFLYFDSEEMPYQEWCHVALTFDMASIKLYVNGVKISEDSRTYGNSSSDADLFIGSDPFVVCEYFNGFLKDLAIWNRALSDTEIATLAGGGTIAIPENAPPIIPKQTFIFDANGGTGEMNPQTIMYDSSAKLSANKFKKNGFVFLGWATKKGGPVVYANTQNVKNVSANDKTTTLYAAWAKKSYKVVFNANGGMGRMTAQKQTYGKAKKLPKNIFKRQGWLFIGWGTSKAKAKKGLVSYTNKQSIKNLRADGKNTTLFAVWAKKNYNVAFYANGAKGKMTVQGFTYGKAKKLSTVTFKKKGRKFVGWATTKSNAKKGVVKYKNKQAVKNLVTTGKTVKLYAVWRKK